MRAFGNEGDDPPDPQYASHEDHDARRDANDRDDASAVRDHNGSKHHNHCSGRPRDLDVRTTEHRRDQSSDNRGNKARRGAGARRHSKGEGEREGDDTDGDASDKVPAPSAPHWAVVGGSGKQRPQRGHGAHSCGKRDVESSWARLSSSIPTSNPRATRSSSATSGWARR